MPAPSLPSSVRDLLNPTAESSPKKPPIPVVLGAAGMPTRGFAERLDEGAVLFTPASKETLAVGIEVTVNWQGPATEREWSGKATHQSLVIVERSSVAGEERYLLLPPEACREPRRSSTTVRSRRRGFRAGIAERRVEAVFKPSHDGPFGKGTLDNLSIGGAALAVSRDVEARATHTVELDVTLSLSPRRPPTRIRTIIRNRRLAGDLVVWGLAFRFDASPEPIRAEAAVRDYLIRNQLEAMRKRAHEARTKAGRPVFYIPTRPEHWDRARPDPSARAAALAWTLLEAKRTRATAARLFPSVDFMIVEDVPASQTYEPGSVNSEIKKLLENHTAIRLQPKRRR